MFPLVSLLSAPQAKFSTTELNYGAESYEILGSNQCARIRHIIPDVQKALTLDARLTRNIKMTSTQRRTIHGYELRETAHQPAELYVGVL